MQPALRVDRFGGLCRRVAVAPHHPGALHEQFAVVGDSDLDAWQRLAHRARAGVLQGRERADETRFRHSPALGHRQAEADEELERIGRDRSGPGDGEEHLIQPHPLPQLAEHQLVGDRMLRFEKRGHRASCDQGIRLLGSDIQRPVDQLRLGPLLGRHRRFEARLELVPDHRNAQQHRRFQRSNGWGQLLGVGEGGHGHPHGHRDIVGQPPVGQVCVGKVRQRPGSFSRPADLGDLQGRFDAERHVGVGELDALRGARGAGRIDDGHQVVGFDRTPGCLEVEVVPVALFEVGQLLDLQDVLDLPSDLARRLGDGAEELLLTHHHAVPGVLEQVGDLVDRAGVVHRERHCAEMQQCGVDQVELGPIGQHQRNRVAAAHAQLMESGGDLVHPLGVLGIGDDDGALRVAKRDARRMLGDRVLEGLAEAHVESHLVRRSAASRGPVGVSVGVRSKRGAGEG